MSPLMTEATMSHVQAAIRHRNLSLRILLVLIGTAAVVALGAAVVQTWWTDMASGFDGVAGAGQGFHLPDLVAVALGHFTLALLIAGTMAGVYEIMVVRHLRGIARQVRGRDWLERRQSVRLNRRWLGVSDDLERIAGALNDARDQDAATRSALTWQIAKHRDAGADLAREVSRLKELNARLESDCREQAAYAAEMSRQLRDPAEALCFALEDVAAIEWRDQVVHPLRGDYAAERASLAAGRVAALAVDIGAYGNAAQMRAPSRAVDLSEVVQGVAERVRSRVAAMGAAIEMSEMPIVRGEVELLQCLFRGLIEAALGNPADGRPMVVKILAGGRDQDGRITISVRDTGGGLGGGAGLGIEPGAVLGAAAAGSDPEPDQSARPALAVVGDKKPKAPSAGAAFAAEKPELTLFRRIVRAHGGDLASRPAPGGGTIVEFKLLLI